MQGVLTAAGGVSFRQHRFDVVVWERIVEPGLIARLDGFCWISADIPPHALFPQAR